jgi:hypothetical protein
MKTTIKRVVILSLLWLIVVGHVAALDVIPSSKGTTFITWDWDAGTNTTALYVDGNLLCGYDTEIPSVNVLGFTPGSCHNLSVTIDVPAETAENVSCTYYLPASSGGGQSSGNSDTGMGIGTNAIIFGLIGALVGGVVVIGKFMNKG